LAIGGHPFGVRRGAHACRTKPWWEVQGSLFLLLFVLK
jgi:hypothetical protein